MAEAESVKLRLECHGIRHSYGSFRVLNGVDLRLRHGETLAIMGRSGCGKSTLLRCISLLEHPTAGDAELEGQQYMSGGDPLFALWEIRSQIGMVFQEYNLFPNMTALRNITLTLEKVRKLSPSEAKERALTIADQLGITELLNRYPDSMSGGQRQRLALARTMVLKPSVLLLDEITSALDPESVANVVDAIRHIRTLDDRGGLGIVLVTHLLSFAVEFADRIAFLHNGSLLEEWPSKDFTTSCQHAETRDFVSRFGWLP